MKAPELKPCPFCGGEAQKFSRANDASHGWAHDVDHWISCASEDCCVTVGMCETEREAITAWNSRTPDPDIDAHIGAMLEQAAGEVRALAFGRVSDVERVCAAILALRPDALQALERVRREARVEGMRAAADVCEGIRHRIANGPMPEGARFDYEQAIRALIAAEKEGKP